MTAIYTRKLVHRPTIFGLAKVPTLFSPSIMSSITSGYYYTKFHGVVLDSYALVSACITGMLVVISVEQVIENRIDKGR